MFFASERYGDSLDDECYCIDSLDHTYDEGFEEEETVCCPSCGNEFGHVPQRRNRPRPTLVERFNRLQYEAKLLEADLRKAVEQQTEAAAKQPFRCGDEPVSLTQLAEQVSCMSERLKELPSIVGKSCGMRVTPVSGQSSPAVEVVVPQAARVATVADGEEAESDEDEAPQGGKKNPKQQQRRKKGSAEDGTQNSDTVALKTLVDLDRRLAVLEKTVGCGDVEAALGAAPLCETVVEWRKRLLVLTAAQLEVLKSKINDVQQSMADLRFTPDASTRMKNADVKPAAASAAASSSDGETPSLTAHDLAQVQKVVENMERWEKTRKALPEIVERLRTLAPLHEASASFVERLDEVETKQDATQKMMDDLQLIVVRLEQSLTLNSKRLTDNVQALEARISAPKK